MNYMVNKFYYCKFLIRTMARHLSHVLNPAWQAFPVTTTTQYLATVNNSFMVVVMATRTGLKQLLNVLQIALVIVSGQDVLFITHQTNHYLCDVIN